MAQPERHVRVRAAEFSPERLDTGFYARAYFDTREAIRGSGLKTESIGSVCEPWQFGAYALCNHIEWSDAASGVPYIKAEALGSPLLNESGLAYVTPATHRLLEKSQLKPGDIVVSTSGTIGLCAVLHERLGEANSNQDTIKFNPSSAGYDCYFVAAWIASAPGQVFLHREAGGAVQQHVYLYNFKRLPLLKIAAEAQRYIGDKVRQAERLRERARRLEAESRAFFQLQEWTEPRAGTRRAYTARRGALRSERLDAPFYDPGHEDLDALLRRRGDTELSEVASLVEARWTRGGDRFSYFEIGELDIGSGILTPTTTEVAAAPSRAQILVEPWDVLVSTVRPNRKNVGLVLPSDDSLALVASTGFAVLRFENAASAAFYHSFLRSDAATQQLMRWNSGATYPAIESDVPLRVRAPLFDGEVVQREGRRWLEKFIALSASRGLILVATTLVERLIDGRITEADLVATQKALESGDCSADREILKALRQSDVPDAKSLIADVDALYALLDASEGQNA
ncbi:hypothetical protein [Myxococcus sp. CA040A]|uniref:hypothetical protein n=1 Tax=Myxococcus sp. CA040A TaxID=2741738 RepID=UPI00157B9DA1|nr:hypothetical protein [Myxococcus sp. CA040A]NTX03848.1 hypothetical protein [Myxococcus sp. CA040A]